MIQTTRSADLKGTSKGLVYLLNTHPESAFSRGHKKACFDAANTPADVAIKVRHWWQLPQLLLITIASVGEGEKARLQSCGALLCDGPGRMRAVKLTLDVRRMVTGFNKCRGRGEGEHGRQSCREIWSLSAALNFLDSCCCSACFQQLMSP